MRRKMLFTLILAAPVASLLAVAPAGAATTVYKWVDEHGVVHYSDQPHANAQKLHVEEAQTYKATPVPAATADTGGTPLNAAVPTYQGCNITQPADDQSYANIDALTVAVRVDPLLRSGDQVYISMDGQALNNGAPTGTSFTISPVDRGSHTLQAQVRGSDGALLCQGPGITVHVQQTSVLNPNNPQNTESSPGRRPR